MGKLSKNKGKVGEREVAALLRQFGFGARRGQQFAGGGDSPDVVHDMDGFHIEVKRTEQFGLWAALDQANRDKKKHEAPVIFHRKNNREWVVVLTAADFLALCRDYVFEKENADASSDAT